MVSRSSLQGTQTAWELSHRPSADIYSMHLADTFIQSDFKANVLFVFVPWNGIVGTFQQRKISNPSNRNETYEREVPTKKSVAEE